jgi:hypothetical protein
LPDPDFITPGSLRRQLRAAGFVEEATRRHFLLAYTSSWRVDKSEQSGREPAYPDRASDHVATPRASR